jgi:5'-deoxynucleotidase YfbR-like HD superfamily hydrolase
MVEKDCSEFSKICKKDWKPYEENPSIFHHLGKINEKECLENLMIGEKEVTYQAGGKIIKENIEKVKKLKSFKNLSKTNFIKI